MPRSSRSKSHKQHKHSSKDARDYTDSEEEESLKERKAREEPAVVSGIRVSNDVESGEKKKVRDLLIPGSSGYSEEHGSTRRRKDRADSSIGSGRLNGREEERLEGLVGESTTKSENFMHDAEKIPRSKGPTDSKNKSSRRHESGSERRDENLVFSVDNEESKRVTGKVDLKRKLEKGSSRKESHQYKDLKEKERGAEKEKKVRDGRRPSSIDIVDITNGGSEGNRKQGALKGEDEHHAKKEVENTEWPLQDVLHKPDFEKEHEKIRPGDAYGDKNGRDEGKHLSSREGGQRNKSYKVETHEDDIYKDKHHKFLEKDLKHNSEKHRDERFSRHHSTDKYENKHFREDNKSSESHNKKVKLQDNDHDGSPREDYRSVRYRDNGGRRVSPDDEGRTDIKSRGTKEQSTDGGKTALSSSKQGSSLDRRSPESHSRHLNAVNSAASSNRQLKSSPGSSVHVEEVHRRHASKPVESIYGDSLSEERLRHSSTRDFPDRVSESQSRERLKRKADSHSGESQVENTVNSKFELTEERRFSNRTGEDRVQDFPFQKLAPGDFSQVEPLHREPTPSSSSFSRMGPTSANSPTLHLPPFRHEVENPSVMVSEDDSRGQGGDLKPKNRSYRRFGDTSSIGRGRGNSAWKGIPNWSVPLANGFIPFQHGQPPTGFHPVLQQFSAPMFGVGPSMEMNHAGVSWHDPGHPFGWQNHADDSCPPHLHGWDRNNGGFGDDSRTYARSDWDPSRHLSSQGPGTCTDIWKGQNGNNMEFPAHKEQDYSGQVASDEIWDGGSFQRACNERNRPIRLPAESIEIKRSCSSPSAKTTATEAPLPPPSVVQEKMPELSKSSKLDDAVDFCHVYLSKLDISLDLAGPELYNQCMNLTGTERDTAVVSTGTYDKYTEEGTIPGTKSSNYGLWSLLFPASSDIVSQRSMALYRKQQEKMKAKIPISPAPGPGLEKLSTAFDEEVARPTMDHPEQHVVKAASSSSYEQITVALVDPSGKINEQKFDTVSSGVVISGSQACETLMPESIECRLSLSRIHNSPENTH